MIKVRIRLILWTLAHIAVPVFSFASLILVDQYNALLGMYLIVVLSFYAPIGFCHVLAKQSGSRAMLRGCQIALTITVLALAVATYDYLNDGFAEKVGIFYMALGLVISAITSVIGIIWTTTRAYQHRATRVAGLTALAATCAGLGMGGLWLFFQKTGFGEDGASQYVEGTAEYSLGLALAFAALTGALAVIAFLLAICFPVNSNDLNKKTGL